MQTHTGALTHTHSEALVLVTWGGRDTVCGGWISGWAGKQYSDLTLGSLTAVAEVGCVPRQLL